MTGRGDAAAALPAAAAAVLGSRLVTNFQTEKGLKITKNMEVVIEEAH